MTKENKQALALLAEDAELGHENLGADDLGINFLTIAQKQSKCVEEKVAQIGQILATSSNTAHDEIEVIFTGFIKLYTRWTPVEDGGGFQGLFSRDDAIVKSAKKNDKGKLVLPGGDELVLTAYHSVLANIEGNWVPSVIPMASSNLEAHRRMNEVMMADTIEVEGVEKTKARYSHVWIIRTVKKEKGAMSWFVFSVSKQDTLASEDVDLFVKAREMSNSTTQLFEPMTKALTQLEHQPEAAQSDGHV